jgi:hypothetical protein
VNKEWLEKGNGLSAIDHLLIETIKRVPGYDKLRTNLVVV